MRATKPGQREDGSEPGRHCRALSGAAGGSSLACTGVADAEGFLLSGSAAVDFLDKEALGRDRKSFRDFSSILDFGCGCGRLIRSLRPLCDQWASIHGCDIDPAAIAWCKENIPDASFSTVGETPPLHFQDKSIDLTYACSVFTHFDADNQFRWLAELQRIMKPGGYLLVTFRYRHNVELIADQAVRDRIWTDSTATASLS